MLLWYLLVYVTQESCFNIYTWGWIKNMWVLVSAKWHVEFSIIPELFLFGGLSPPKCTLECTWLYHGDVAIALCRWWERVMSVLVHWLCWWAPLQCWTPPEWMPLPLLPCSLAPVLPLASRCGAEDPGQMQPWDLALSMAWKHETW